jgi:hypothetical protein
MTDRLYNLLPAVYRVRDSENGGALRALLGVMESELQALDADISGLYDNWFIETAAEWVVPYIGDLLGVGGLHSSVSSEFSLRAYVANTLAYRRRKGTATMLEQLAHDITGWNAHVVEYFERLETTQYLNHVRPFNLRTPNLRDADALELLNTPFETAARTVDIRHISNAGLHPEPIGRHNIPNIGIYLWRLQGYTVEQSDAHPAGLAGEFYTFSPLGDSQPLFNPPRTEVAEGAASTITHLAEEINVPTPLRRRPLYIELENLRQSSVDGTDFTPQYFDPDRPVLQVFADDPNPIPAEQLLICDLSDWRNPPETKDYDSLAANGTNVTTALPIKAAVDPVLGRLAFPSGVTPTSVRVSFAYGFSGDVGGGPYHRSVEIPEVIGSSTFWQVGVSQRVSANPGEIYNALTDAIEDWNSQPPGTIGVIAIMDSCTYKEDLTGPNTIRIRTGSQLLLVAADWPAVEDPFHPSIFVRHKGELTPDEVRPHIQGDISVAGLAPANDPNPGALRLNGLLLEGNLTVLAGNLGSLQLDHCTLVPVKSDLTVATGGTGANSKNPQLKVQLQRTISGQLTLPESVPFLSATDSILDGAGVGLAINAPGAAVMLDQCTVYGQTAASNLEASNTIFMDIVTVERRQTGCVRYSFLPEHSVTPRRYRCQPDLALAERAQALGLRSTNDLSSAEQTPIVRRMTPGFGSIHHGDPDYAQLSRNSDPGILTGAEDGSEMGVFSYLKQPQREANLRSSLDEYLRLGLEAGIFFVT